MGIFSNIFKRKSSAGEPSWRVGGMEDFMMLINVYYQAVMASNLGINNLNAFPQLRDFKRTLHVPTANNKIGVSEKNKCKAMFGEMYGISDGFFKEIDNSIKRNCKNINAVQGYSAQFQAFSQELMMVVGNLMKWKFRIPGFLRGALRNLTEKTINDILTKNNWKDAGVGKACFNIRHYQANLGYSAEWMTEYVFNIIVLAKKEPKPKDTDEK